MFNVLEAESKTLVFQAPIGQLRTMLNVKFLIYFMLLRCLSMPLENINMFSGIDRNQ